MTSQRSTTDLRVVFAAQDITKAISDVTPNPRRFGGSADIHQGVWASDSGAQVVAIKFIRSGDDELEKTLRRHRREIRMWHGIDHPNILRLLGLYWGSGRQLPAMVSMWCQHTSLRHFVKEVLPGPDVMAQKYTLLKQVISGLAHLHSRNPPIVHGDMKGDNILVSDDSIPKICDFGLSKIPDVTTETSTHVRGTCRWMAPELLLDEGPVSTAGDIWAYACVIVEVLTGLLPYPDIQKEVGVVVALARRQIPARPADASDACWDLALKCFAFDPAARPSASELLSEPLFALSGPSATSDNPDSASFGATRNNGAEEVHGTTMASSPVALQQELRHKNIDFGARAIAHVLEPPRELVDAYSRTITSTKRRVKIFVVAAVDLPRSVFRAPKPLAVVTVDGEQELTTKRVKNSCNPYWNEVCVVEVTSDSSVTIEVKDKHKLNPKHPERASMGTVSVRIGDYLDLSLEMEQHKAVERHLCPLHEEHLVRGKLIFHLRAFAVGASPTPQHTPSSMHGTLLRNGPSGSFASVNSLSPILHPRDRSGSDTFGSSHNSPARAGRPALGLGLENVPYYQLNPPHTPSPTSPSPTSPYSSNPSHSHGHAPPRSNSLQVAHGEASPTPQHTPLPLGAPLLSMTRLPDGSKSAVHADQPLIPAGVRLSVSLFGPAGRGAEVEVLSGKVDDYGASAVILRGQVVHAAQPLYVALKVFRDVLDPTLLNRELDARTQVQHRYILSYMGTASWGCDTILVAPYMKNGNLTKYLDAHPRADRATLMLQVADAVRFLHDDAQPRRVHGNLKCENVLVSDSGNALLEHFSLTMREQTENTPTTVTEIRQHRTLRFAAPELLIDSPEEETLLPLTAGPSRRPRAKTMASDVYAFGMLMLQAYSGEVPWREISNMKVYVEIARGQAPPRPSARHLASLGFTEEHWNLCLRCWSQDPELRPSMRQILRTLEELRAQ